MLMNIISRLYHTPHFLKERGLGLTRNVHGTVKKDREREREREREGSHAGHACQPSIRIVMPGMKMNEMSCKKRTKE